MAPSGRIAKALLPTAVVLVICACGLSLVSKQRATTISHVAGDSPSSPVAVGSISPAAPDQVFRVSECNFGIDTAELRDGNQHFGLLSHELNKVSQSCSLDEYLEEGSGSAEPALIGSVSGQFFIVLASIETEFGPMYQILNRLGDTDLVSGRELRDATFDLNTVWMPKSDTIINKKLSNEIPIEFDRLWHTFGLTKLGDPLETTFRITNRGEVPIECDSIRGSCGCVSITPKAPFTIMPEENRQINVIVGGNPGESLSQSVAFQFIDKIGDRTLNAKFDVYGNSLHSMEIMPTSIDFGLLASGSSLVERTIVLRETPQDRFAIQEINSDAIPTVDISRTVELGESGLRSYKLVLRLRHSPELRGHELGELVISTDSKLRPTVSVPIRWRAEPQIRVQPSVLSYGSVKLGEEVSRKLRITSSVDDPLELRDVSAPDDFDVESTEVEGAIVLNVRFRPTELGIAQHTLLFAVAMKMSNRNEEVCVKTVSLVRE